MNKIEYLTIDDEVNVYVVGDIHGDYDQLINRLKELGFRFDRDLLLAVGDLIDRGEQNEKCVGLINELWFKTVRGNHEDFCIKGFMNDTIAFYHKMQNNGGEWFYKQPEGIQQAIVNIFDKLPYMLEVSYRGKKFGFVHADLPYEDWELIKECVNNNDIINGRDITDYLIWSRGIIENYESTGYEPIIAQVDNVFLGHTVLPEVTQVGNITFLDTGGCFKKFDNRYKLSIINLSDYA